MSLKSSKDPVLLCLGLCPYSKVFAIKEFIPSQGSVSGQIGGSDEISCLSLGQASRQPLKGNIFIIVLIG